MGTALSYHDQNRCSLFLAMRHLYPEDPGRETMTVFLFVVTSDRKLKYSDSNCLLHWFNTKLGVLHCIYALDKNINLITLTAV